MKNKLKGVILAFLIKILIDLISLYLEQSGNSQEGLLMKHAISQKTEHTVQTNIKLAYLCFYKITLFQSYDNVRDLQSRKKATIFCRFDIDCS